MSNAVAKRFIYIDDRPDAAISEALGAENVGVFSFPEDLNERMDELIAIIDDCSVIIVDLKLADDAGDGGSLLGALYPKDGLALKEVLTSILTERAALLDSGTDAEAVDIEPKNTAFVLYSGELDLLGGGAPAHGREHVIAKKIRAEWAMHKRPQSRPASQTDLKVLEQLATAVEAVAETFWDDALDRGEMLNLIAALLALDQQTEWASIAQRQVFESRPPLQSLAEQDGMALLRWLLHLVLPYPSFLLDPIEVALLCRLQPNWLADELNMPTSKMAKLFEASRYRGILSNFLGPRWWRAGILATLRQMTDGSLHDARRLHSRIQSMYQAPVPVLSEPTPVRTVDEEFRLTGEIVDVEQAVRLEPEEWPAELAPPWMPLTKVAESARLQRYVMERDIDRVQAFSSASDDGEG